MRILFLFVILLASACAPKETPAPYSETPMILQNNPAPNKCDIALSAIPIYNEKNEMYGEIFQFYKNYNDCMDAGIAEGMETMTTMVFSRKWKQLNEFNKLAQQDSGFKKFALGNIDSLVTGLNKEVQDIAQKSQNNCPKDLTGLCKEILAAAKNALKAEAEDLK